MKRIAQFSWKKLLQWNIPDPIYVMFSRRIKGNPTVIAFLIGLLHIGIWIAVDRIIVLKFPNKLMETISFAFPDELVWGLFLWGIFIPIIWWFYLSFPKLCESTLASLKHNCLVREEVTDLSPQGPFTFISLILGLFVGWIYMSRLMEVERNAPPYSFWFEESWSVFLLVFLVVINSYIFITFILNTLFFSYQMRKFFNNHGVLEVKLFHADSCGGFGVVGSLAMKLSSLAVLAGVWAVWYTLKPLFRGGKPISDIGVYLVYVVYVILVPMLLLLLTWSLHNAMLAFKRVYMGQIGEKLVRVFNAIASSPFDQPETNLITDDNLERYRKLLQLYERADTLPVWPISIVNLKKFSVFASLPGVVGLPKLIKEIMEIYKLIVSQ